MNVPDTIEAYERGELTATETLDRLRNSAHYDTLLLNAIVTDFRLRVENRRAEILQKFGEKCTS